MMTNDEVSSRIRKHGFSGRLCLLPTGRIADLSIAQMLKGKKVIIPGLLNKVNWILLRLIPVPWQLFLLSRMVRSELGHETKQLPERYSEVNDYASQKARISAIAG